MAPTTGLSSSHDAFAERLRALTTLSSTSPLRASRLVADYSSKAVSRGATSVARMQAMLQKTHTKSTNDLFSFIVPGDENAPLQQRVSSQKPPPRTILPRASSAQSLRRSATPTAAAIVAPRRSTIYYLHPNKKKDVMRLFEAFAAKHTKGGGSSGNGSSFSGSGGGGDYSNVASVAALKASALLGGAAASKLGCTRKGFETLLRMYYRLATNDEIEAMLASVEGPLDELLCAKWALDAKGVHGATIRRIFAKADKDGSGGIDVSEFAAAVEAANISEAHVRDIFDAADKDGNGVLDFDEFFDVLSASPVLKEAFTTILAHAQARKERCEHERLAYIFRSPAKVQQSPGGHRRMRPSLVHLRPMHETRAMPWHKEALTSDDSVAVSPQKTIKASFESPRQAA